MFSREIIKKFTLIYLFFQISSFVAGADFHVSPAGSDSNPGTLLKPFATIQKARDAVRKINKSMDKDIRVFIHGGTYYLKTSLLFGPQDSGFNKHHIIYCNYKNEKPAIIGGLPVTGWKPFEKGIMRAEVGKDVEFWSLLVNKKLANIASRNGKLDPSFSKTLSVKNMQLYLQGAWMAEYLKITGFDENGNPLTEFNAAKFTRRGKRHPKFLGSVQFIDQPGEWALDSDAGFLYLLPEKKDDLNSVIRPTVKSIFQLKGDSAEKRVENITIQGLELILTDFNANMRSYSGITENGYEYSSVDRENTLRTALVTIENARGISIRECNLHEAPVNAVAIYGPAENNIVYGCRITSIGYNCVYLAGYKLTKDYIKDENRNNIVSNNEMSDIMRTVNHASGVLIYQSSGNKITHNMIHHSRRYGISLKGIRYRMFTKIGLDNVDFDDQWKYLHSNNNLIAYNYMYNLGADSADGGGVETWGAGRDNVIDHNIIFDAYTGRAKKGWRGHSIFLDDGSNYWTTTNNIVWNTITPTVNADCNIKGVDMATFNNVFDVSLCKDGAANMEAYAEKSENQSFDHNIVYSNGKSSILIDGQRGETLPESLLLFRVKPCKLLAKCDYNLYFTAGVPAGIEVNKKFTSFEDWKKLDGKHYDAHSKFADPGFINIKERDYRLRVDSPAWKMGIKSIDTASIGLLPDFSFARKDDNLKRLFLKSGDNDIFISAKSGDNLKLSLSARTTEWYSADLSDAQIKYDSDNSKVAVVDANGNVSVKGKGKALITASATKNGITVKDGIVIFSEIAAPQQK